MDIIRFRIAIQGRANITLNKTYKDTLDDLSDDVAKIVQGCALENVNERLYRNSLERLTRQIHNCKEEDNSHTYYQLGYYYHYGVGPVKKDEEKAMENYQLAIEHNHPGAYYQLAELFHDRCHYENIGADELPLMEGISEQVKMLTKSAAEGRYTQSYRKLKDSYVNSEIWTHAIDNYYQSLQQSIDITEDAKLLSQTYNELGILAIIFAESDKEKDKNESKLQIGYDYFEKSRQLGKPAASYNLAVYKFAPTSCTNVDKKNIEYYLMAAEQGHCLAQFELAGIFQSEIVDNPDKDSKEALDLLLKSSRYGYSDILYKVGLAYMNGIGIGQDLSTAKEYFELAIVANSLFDGVANDRQFFALGYVYHKGLGVPIDLVYAAHFYSSGILHANCSKCCLFLAKLIEQGAVANLNIGSAIKLHMKVVEAETDPFIGYAHYRLGKIFGNNNHYMYSDPQLSKIHYQCALDHYRNKKRKNHLGADDAYHMGVIYQDGLGTKRDYAAALNSYQKTSTIADSSGCLYDKHYAQKADNRIDTVLNC